MTGVSGGDVTDSGLSRLYNCVSLCEVRVCVCLCELGISAVVADEGSTLRYHRCAYKHNVL